MAKVGDMIKIINMQGEPQYTGKTGKVTNIDDIGQLHGTWGGCALIPEEDEFEVIVDEEMETDWSKQTCCFCGEPLWNGHGMELDSNMKTRYFGNNPWPACEDEDARCCDKCNNEIVIPARIKMMFK